MAKKRTIFQTLDSAISGNWNLPQEPQVHVSSYDMTSVPNKILYKTDNKEDYERKKLELRQSKYLKEKWFKINQDLTVQAFNGLNQIKLMYNEADLMDAMPEIGAALDTYSDEACLPASDGNVIQVYSKSSRVKSILEDLFVNRLNVQITSQMIIRGMCKYGNQFMVLDVDEKHGVKGWKQLPVFEVERLENGVQNPYGGLPLASQQNDNDTSTQFIWTNATVGGGVETHFRNWQIAHFRLLNNSMYLPYGCSILNSARRHWRMLSLMEDMMLIYRLERSMERRVYKIFVGGIDDADVQAYVETVANNFKRTPIIDPLTGQIDLRKNILPVHKDTPIPLLDGRTITIEQLAMEYENGKDNYVYSIQDKTHKIVPGKVVWCGKNYTAKKLVKITLDDDSHMIMAPEHEIIMRDGPKKRADEVVAGESVMPFYRKVESVYNSGDYEYTHRLIGERIKKANDNFKEFYSEIKKNYKIKSVEYVDGADVYCMTVTGLNGEDDRHNFALKTWDSEGCATDSGVFVANCWDQDIFIPTRDPAAPNPIDTLSAGQNLTAMDDIKYVQNKILAALRIPKSFINFEEAAGEGKNLALMDVRFTRMVNRVQQAFLMEMTKVATIHLYLMGFEDDLTNFTLAMNNPSTQAEQLEVEVLQKKIDVVRDAVSDPGNGLQVMSLQRALKDVMKWSEKDIKTNLEEIRLEKAIAAELEKTQQIIKKTGIFDSVDRIYGEPGAQYADEQPQQGGEGGGMGGGMPGMGGGGGPTDFGDAMDGLDNAGGDMGGDINGLEGEEPTADMGGGEPPMENADLSLDGVLINESKAFNTLMERLNDETPHASNTKHIHADVYDNAYVLNEEIDKMLKSLDEFGKTE